MKIAWLTDIHLNFIDDEAVLLLCAQVNALKADKVLISGDIAEGHSITAYLELLAQHISSKIYFVLGNHDYYYSSITKVRTEVSKLVKSSDKLFYLNDEDLISLSEKACLIGHDGWADGRNGDYFASAVMLSDYQMIAELCHIDRDTRFERLNALGDEACASLRGKLMLGLSQYDLVILLTHVPPFTQAAWHEGFFADQDFAPHFSNQGIGEMLVEVMSQYPHKQLQVYCGHSHSGGVFFPLANICVVTGKAAYRSPEIQPPILVT